MYVNCVVLLIRTMDLFSAQKMSVKRKRMSLRRIPSSSSEDGTAAPLTESDLSDSVSADSHSLSAGEEEPPTKRKRDKALKTAAERNRKSGRMTARALSPKSSAVQKMPREETALMQDVTKASSDENADTASARNCVVHHGEDSVVKNGTEIEKVFDRPRNTENLLAANEDCSGGSVLPNSHNCVTAKTTTDNADTTTHSESGDSAEVAVRKECSGGDCASVPASKCSADESREKECISVKEHSCSAEATDLDRSIHENADSECSGQRADKTARNASSGEDNDTESHREKDEGHKNHEETHCGDVAEVTTQSNVPEDESKSDIRTADKLASNGHPACNAKKMRGRPRKYNKKGRKKREHSNVTNTASVTEVQETDYEPTKKLGRPSKKSKLAQLADEASDTASVTEVQESDYEPTKKLGRPSKKSKLAQLASEASDTASVTEVQQTDYEPMKKLGRPSKKSKLAQLVAEASDSLPQSEDDIPLIELRRSEDDIPLIELRRSARANKGQRKLDQLVLEQPKKRNRAKIDEKERKRAEEEEKRQKREAELQEQAALKAKKVSNILLYTVTFVLFCVIYIVTNVLVHAFS